MSINDELFNSLKISYRSKWFEYSEQLDLRLEKVSLLEKIRNEKQLDNIIDTLISKISDFPEDEIERVKWQEESSDFIELVFKEFSILKLGLVDKDLKRGFIDSTYNFVNKCRNYDKELSFEDIGQALRNVWIVNILQKIFGKTVEYNESVFAYSMLYPYTDNFLDDTSTKDSDKRNFNQRFSERLVGKDVETSNILEEKAFDMISIIEKNYERIKYEDVYKSLNYIQGGQIKSLTQQNKKSNPYECDVLDISIEKGGASVLVDGYLIDGSMDYEQCDFSFGYGFLLQLCDDLQDVKEDYENNHMTVMSQLCGKYYLDNVVNKLINFTYDLIGNATCFKCYDALEVSNLIIQNILLMILVAVVKNKNYFSKQYSKFMNDHIPFRIKYIAKLSERVSNKFKSLQPCYGGKTVEDILYKMFY